MTEIQLSFMVICATMVSTQMVAVVIVQLTHVTLVTLVITVWEVKRLENVLLVIFA